MNKTITMTCMNRPDYTKEVLQSLKNQNKSLDDYKLYINIDTGNCKEVVDICNDIDFIETDIKIFKLKEVRVNHRVNNNTHDVITRAFYNKSDFNLYIEDDIVLSPDALDLMDWYIEQDLTDIATLCLCNIIDKEINENLLCKVRHCCLWGFVISKVQFYQYYKPAWLKGYSWDTSIARYIRTFPGIYNMMPMFSRSHNIGAIGVNAEIHHRQFMEGHQYNTVKNKIFDYEV